MHRLFLPLVVLTIAVGIGCTSVSPSPSATSAPASATSTPMPTPTDAQESLGAATPEEFFLSTSSPENESVVDSSPVEVRGSTVVDAVVTVNGQLMEVGPQGKFAAQVDLQEGPNVIEVVASDFSGHEEAVVLSVIYIP